MRPFTTYMSCPDDESDDPISYAVEMTISGTGMASWLCPCGDWHDEVAEFLVTS